MAAVAGLALAGVVLWLWLTGKWIGRALVCLGGAGLVFMFYLVANVPGAGVLNLVIGLPLAWIVGSAPTWVWRIILGHPTDYSRSGGAPNVRA